MPTSISSASQGNLEPYPRQYLLDSTVPAQSNTFYTPVIVMTSENLEPCLRHDPINSAAPTSAQLDIHADSLVQLNTLDSEYSTYTRQDFINSTAPMSVQLNTSELALDLINSTVPTSAQWAYLIHPELALDSECLTVSY
ncbi:2700_t:CDS:2 [Ambispora leptoticha]|uniref:2700_t:CDS:1 n=1 Tax=Ambispora leptoticha TaxID=144679 RepID=A0A9N9B5Z7_9GLOM|nr:2700_t:CDS:2 [Ambispora leptoticha]